MQVLLVPREVDDRITDELSGSVEGDVAAPLDFVELDATGREQRG